MVAWENLRLHIKFNCTILIKQNIRDIKLQGILKREGKGKVSRRFSKAPGETADRG